MFNEATVFLLRNSNILNPMNEHNRKVWTEHLLPSKKKERVKYFIEYYIQWMNSMENVNRFNSAVCVNERSASERLQKFTTSWNAFDMIWQQFQSPKEMMNYKSTLKTSFATLKNNCSWASQIILNIFNA